MNKYWLPLLFLFVFTIRLVNLTKIPVFADEAIYIRWSQIMTAVPSLKFVPLTDGKQPLFMWLLVPILQIFKDPLFAGRFLSVICGTMTALGIYFVTEALFKNKKITYLAVFVYAILPFTFFFDRMALVDSMLSMFGVWSFYFGYKAVAEGKFKFSILGGVTLGLAWLTKSPAVFFVLLFPSLLIFSSKKYIIRNTLYIILPMLLAFVIYNSLRLSESFHMLNSRNMDYLYPIAHIFENPIDPFIPHLKDVWNWFVHLGGVLLISLFLIGILNINKHLKAILILLVWFLAPLFAEAMYAKVFTARYILFTLPYLIILASSVFQNTKYKILNSTYALVSLIFIYQSLTMVYKLIIFPESADLPRNERSGYFEEWTAGQGIKETADYLRAEYARDKKEIVVGTEGYFGTLPDGLQIYLNDIPDIKIIGIGLFPHEIPIELINSVKFGTKTYLLMNDQRMGKLKPTNPNLKLIASYPKAIRPNLSPQNLMFFEVK